MPKAFVDANLDFAKTEPEGMAAIVVAENSESCLLYQLAARREASLIACSREQ